MATELNNAMVSFENSRVKVIVNPDGSNFTYGFKSLIGDSTNKTFTGRFTVTATGTAQLAYGNTKYMTAGESGTITITFTRTDNTVTVSSTETWSNNGSSVYTIGTWYAEYNGATNHFLLYPSSGKNSDRFEGTYTDGTMKGKMYLKGIGYCIEFTAG